MRRWELYQFANRLKQGNHWLQILLIFSLILGMNHFALKHFVRYDLTQNHRYALSPESKAYLSELREPVEIVVTIPADSPRQEEQVLYRYVEQLLAEYAYQSRRNGEFLISVRFVDIYKDLAEADALAREFGLDQVNAILIYSENRKRLVRADEMVSFVDRKAVAFKGESALTAAIMEVSQEKSPKLYFLTGHREVAPDDTSPRGGLSQIARELQLRNFTLEQLDLTAVSGVPEDTAILLIPDPKGPLLPSEVDKIRTYLFDKAGRVILWTRPGVDTGMKSLLREWGLLLPDQLVIEPDPAYRESTQSILIRNFGEHPITSSLIQNQTYVITGLNRPVIPGNPQPADERLHFIPLFATSNTSWSESSYQQEEAPTFNPGPDFSGPVPVAVATERRASSQLGIKVQGGRLVVFGSPDIFSNQRISSLGNVSVLFNTINWMLDRDKMLVIPPRPVATYQLSLSQNDLKKIGLMYLIVPGALALCGLLIYWVRKS
ncbi:GldG family protein [Puniceicoccales bacterium CK1056]|uniref:GldG family protein n=1 Tax=Oceanipulchritudo coccoides TaxID=2706888 RepID=A0A6B2M0Q6_9BACT|nr:GldG family protein [Oceanipulchritudo coccoides]NDV62551.1 GldG family protein [Oceanipulchritudo coccoides]